MLLRKYSQAAESRTSTCAGVQGLSASAAALLQVLPSSACKSAQQSSALCPSPPQVLGELRRLMPGKDPVAVLLADPSGCLDMQVRGVKLRLVAFPPARPAAQCQPPADPPTRLWLATRL